MTEDIAKLIVEIEDSSNNKELLNELVQLQQKTGALKDENKHLSAAMKILQAQLKTTIKYQRMQSSHNGVRSRQSHLEQRPLDRIRFDFRLSALRTNRIRHFHTFSSLVCLERGTNV